MVWILFIFKLDDCISIEEENEEKYSSALLAKIQKLDQTVEIELNDIALTETTSENEAVKLTPVATPVDANSGTEFFGMPTGNEIVASSSPQGEKDILKIINKARIEKGMSELEWDEDLANAARYHAYDLATQDYFDHASFDRSGGKLVQVGGTFDRIKKFYSKSFVNSENIAAGNESAQATYMQWYNSKGHYENMFNESSKKVGLGVFYDPDSVFGYYWVFCTAL